jgi:hypothetical protein
MTENTTRSSNVMEYAEPRTPANGGESQAKEGIGSTNAKNKKIYAIMAVGDRFLPAAQRID